MSWMQTLYQTYQAGIELDLPLDQQLMPISHTPQNAHINIVLNGEGEFLRASVLPAKTQIMLPATESSASRGSGEAPHGLADKIQYVAKDYADYGGQKKAYYEGFRQQLQAWCQSPFAHPKVKAIFRYIEKGTVVADLIAHGVMIAQQDADGTLQLLEQVPDDLPVPELFKVLPKDKGCVEQGSALVCWSVQMQDPLMDTWKDPSIQESWIAFDAQANSTTGICYSSGMQLALATNHPAKIRHNGDKAKLISSNDSSGYTFRGRFLDETQACGVGFEVSQKAHNALRWLINRQGFRNGDQVYVAWAVSGAEVPKPLDDQPMADTDEAFNLDLVDESVIIRSRVDHGVYLGQAYGLKLAKYMAGYTTHISANEQITVMGIDSATPGRMSIIYYRQLLRDEFFQRLTEWHRQFAWRQPVSRELPVADGKKPKTQTIWPICAPLPRDIAVAAYGKNLDDALKKKVVERLLPCILDKAPFPRDLLEQCLHKASNRVAYASDEQWLWEKNLAIACALYKGYYQRLPDIQSRRDYAMALEEDRPDRDYLFGRLLAIADYIEEMALGVGGEKRSTTAARLMQRFADRPYETWRTIELSLQPYMQRLQVARPGFLVNRQKELQQIMAMFAHDDFFSNKALSGEFLLGYHCQRHHYKHKSESNPNRAEGHDANSEAGE